MPPGSRRGGQARVRLDTSLVIGTSVGVMPNTPAAREPVLGEDAVRVADRADLRPQNVPLSIASTLTSVIPSETLPAGS